ncbi:hypothetical protein ILUMI_08649 [Ignelater luminosus]|uniref:EF-hand domain-containing protein n=1 Tax=Ignelater luminosus TaxID=2038154 RepID=A0A8K0D5R6_IGNLU|nr:hypothetical protein ILUMI_08649 [Ignelater luminosus]
MSSENKDESTNEKRASQNSINRSKVSRRSKESQKSLSTITEEPKSLPTIPSQTEIQFPFSREASQNAIKEEEPPKVPVKKPLPPPKIPPPLPLREKKHTSTILKGSSRETVVKHDRPRTLSMQQRLLAHIHMGGKPLFQTVVGEPSPTTPSMLVTGFGLRNLASLQEALQIEEHNRLKQLYKAQEQQEQSSSSSLGESSSTSFTISQLKTESTTETQTDLTPTAAAEANQKKRLNYLMGLPVADEEEGIRSEHQRLLPESQEEQEITTGSEAMKQAQKYLRVHKIFEFFQFIIAHLLSALPENPIQFIIELLDKCLIFRSGLVEPPLLYTRKHLEVLFYLMDRMHTGYIDIEQYKTGMRTVGVCSFNERPPLTKDGMVAKEYFIEEAYDCLTHLLNDIIKRHWLLSAAPVVTPPPPTPQLSSLHTSSANEYHAVHFKPNIFLDAIL